MTAFLLAAQLVASPCPPSLRCTMPLPVAQTTPRAAAIANPEQPAKWYLAAMFVETGVFEAWALESHRYTISQFTQDESREHHAIRWLGVATMAALTWHLFWGF